MVMMMRCDDIDVRGGCGGAHSDKGAAKGIGLGWYGNNCPETRGVGRGPKYCSEHGKLQPDWAAALRGGTQRAGAGGDNGIANR
eukprot:COSAG01_NODE_6598_length_3587_cov_3.169725_4_plen_84_part_00